MKIQISLALEKIYKKQHKNYDYMVLSVLDNLDPQSYQECFKIVRNFDLGKDRTSIQIGDGVIQRIKDDFEVDAVDEMTIVLLLWVGAILPEV